MRTNLEAVDKKHLPKMTKIGNNWKENISGNHRIEESTIKYKFEVSFSLTQNFQRLPITFKIQYSVFIMKTL